MRREYGNQKILQWLYDNHHTMRWLSDESGIPYSSFKRKLYGRTEWRASEIDRILFVTGKKYEELFGKDITA